MTTYDWARDRDTPVGFAFMWMFGWVFFTVMCPLAGLQADTLEKAHVGFYVIFVFLAIGMAVPIALFACTYGLPRRCCGWVRESAAAPAPPPPPPPTATTALLDTQTQ